MPDHLRNTINDKFIGCMESHWDADKNMSMDSKSSGRSFGFVSTHFSIYNRMFTSGANAPLDGHPMELKRADGKKLNYSQFLPVPAKELSDNYITYNLLVDAFDEIFQWIYKTVSNCSDSALLVAEYLSRYPSISLRRLKGSSSSVTRYLFPRTLPFAPGPVSSSISTLSPLRIVTGVTLAFVVCWFWETLKMGSYVCMSRVLSCVFEQEILFCLTPKSLLTSIFTRKVGEVALSCRQTKL